MKISNIVFEGGGVLASAYAGAIGELQRRNLWKDVRGVAGTSGGAITALCVATGMHPTRLMQVISSTDYSKFRDGGGFLGVGSVWNLVAKWSLYDGVALRKFTESIVAEIGMPPETTFLQLYEKTGIMLKVYTTNISTGMACEFSVNKSPSVKVAKAVAASSTVPGFFPPVMFGDEKHVDGGMTMNYPIEAFDQIDLDGTRIPNIETIGFNLDTANEHEGVVENITTPAAYLEKCISLLLTVANKAHIDGDLDWPRTARIDTAGISALDFSITEEKKKILQRTGAEAVSRFLDQKLLAYKAFWEK